MILCILTGDGRANDFLLIWMQLPIIGVHHQSADRSAAATYCGTEPERGGFGQALGDGFDGAAA